MPGELRISSPSYEDLPEVARVHVAAWKQAYVGQVDPAHLDKLDVADRLRRWQEQFPDRNVCGLLIASLNNKTAGFICFGPGRDTDRQDWGEIYAVYVLEPHWGAGIGYRLQKDALAQLKNDGFERAFLWVLDTNHRALEAYRRWGGILERDRLKHQLIGSQPVTEVSVSFCL